MIFAGNDVNLPTRKPGASWAWGYGRQSDAEAINDAEAIPAQGDRTRSYFEFILRPLGVQEFRFVPDTSAVSARQKPFMSRIAGKELLSLMQPGDHLVIDKVDRIWRSVADYHDLRRELDRIGIRWHICNLMGVTIQLGTPGGDLMMNMFVAGAQFESDQVSDRTRSRQRDRRKAGRLSVGNVPMGTMIVGEKVRRGGVVVKDDRRLEWDPQFRKFMGEIVRLADEERCNANDVAKRIKQKHFHTVLDAKWVKKRITPVCWAGYDIAKLYWREKQYRVLGDFNPNTIKFSLFNPTQTFRFRDIGRSEPTTPNTMPFLDGKPVPTELELREMSNA